MLCLDLPIHSIVDDHAEELAVRFKLAIDEMPTNSQTNRNGLAMKRGFFLGHRSEIHVPELAAFGVSPP